jgi:hypothetical protein
LSHVISAICVLFAGTIWPFLAQARYSIWYLSWHICKSDMSWHETWLNWWDWGMLELIVGICNCASCSNSLFEYLSETCI